jgi:formate/nitrite transporter FocA (FNT family)
MPGWRSGGRAHRRQKAPVGRAPPASGTRYSAKEIHDTVVDAALDELGRPFPALWWSAFAGGLLIGFSFLAAAFLSTLSDDPRWQRALTAAGYPLGFIFVVLSSTQLFTENTLDPVLPLLESPRLDMLRRVARLWTILLLGNVAGALAIGVVIAKTPVMPEWMGPALDRNARMATDGTFWSTTYRGIFAGWLVALMAWLISTTADRLAQIVLIVITTAPISAFGFRHAIAGSVEAFYCAAGGLSSWSDMVRDFVVPSILGNALGGGLLVALLFYGQVRSDKAEKI